MADIFGGGVISSLFGSNAAPKAILNQHAAPTAKPLGKFGGKLLGDVEGLSQQAVQDYLGQQGKFQGLAGQQENTLNTLLARRMNADPNQLLQQVGNTAFGFIDPNVISPLARFDVNQDVLMRRARGLNPATVDSTADRLRNSRIASERYYDTAKQAYSALPGLYNEAYGQGLSNEAAAAGLTPQIAQAYEGVANRPFNAINQRIGTATGGIGAANQAIQGVVNATQGYKQPANWADRLGAATSSLGDTVGSLASMAGGAAGGGGGM